MREEDFDFDSCTLLLVEIAAFGQLKRRRDRTAARAMSCSRSYLFNIERGTDFQAFVAVLLRVVLRYGLLEDARRCFRVAMIAHGDIEAYHSNVVNGYFVDIRVVQAYDEALLFDVRFDRPRLLVLVEEGHGDGMGGEWIDNDREDSCKERRPSAARRSTARLLTNSIFEFNGEHEFPVGLKQFTYAIDAKRSTQAVHVGVVHLVQCRVTRIEKLAFLARVPRERAGSEPNAIGQLHRVLARCQPLNEQSEISQLTDTVELRLYDDAPFVVGIVERRRFDLGIERLPIVRRLHRVRVLRVEQLRAELYFGDVGNEKILDFELALNVASLVHEVHRAETIDGGERLAAVQGDFARELALLLDERFVAREMLARQERNAEIQGHLECFRVVAAMEEKGVQLIAVLDECQGEWNVPAEELARDQLLVGAQ